MTFDDLIFKDTLRVILRCAYNEYATHKDKNASRKERVGLWITIIRRNVGRYYPSRNNAYEFGQIKQVANEIVSMSTWDDGAVLRPGNSRFCREVGYMMDQIKSESDQFGIDASVQTINQKEFELRQLLFELESLAKKTSVLSLETDNLMSPK